VKLPYSASRMIIVRMKTLDVTVTFSLLIAFHDVYIGMFFTLIVLLGTCFGNNNANKTVCRFNALHFYTRKIIPYLALFLFTMALKGMEPATNPQSWEGTKNCLSQFDRNVYAARSVEKDEKCGMWRWLQRPNSEA